MLVSMRRLLVPSFLVFCAWGPACGPRGTTTTGGSVSSSGTTAPSSNATAWSSEARDLLERAFGAGRLAWEDPAFKPGERVVWRVRATGAPDLVIDLERRQSSWLVTGNGAEITLVLDSAGNVTTVGWKKGASSASLADPAQIAKVTPARAASDEATFAAAGGTFVGNEVVRVPAGEFRARHGLLSRETSTFHVYVARSVPGGLVKLEEFRGNEIDPVLIVELEDFAKAKKTE